MKTPHLHPIIVRLLLASMLLGVNVHAALFTYNFESLTNGTLAGQDNWVFNFGDAPYIVSTGTGADTTKVVGTAGSTSSNFATRINDGNFSFGSLTGVTSLTLGFDTRYVAGDNGGINNQSHFALDTSSGSTGSARFGLQGNGFIVSNTTTGLPTGVDFDDWISLRLEMDMLANGGNGSGSLYYKNLTDGDPGFTAVSGLQNLNLGYLAQDPSQWSRMVLRTGFYAGNKIDNLYIDTTPVPEPGTALFGVACVGVAALRRRRLSNTK